MKGTLSRRWPTDFPSLSTWLLLDSAKGLYADIFKLAEASLHPGSLVLADDAHHCPDYVLSMRSDTLKYLSIAVAGNLEMFIKLE